MTCDYCGAEYVPKRRRASSRFCSRQCSNIMTARRGKDHPSYNGGVTFNRHLGRWMIVCRDGSQTYFYRGVVAAEIGRLLESHELVHHLNEDPTDDRPENLQITDRSAHARLHDFGSLGWRG